MCVFQGRFQKLNIKMAKLRHRHKKPIILIYILYEKLVSNLANKKSKEDLGAKQIYFQSGNYLNDGPRWKLLFPT